MNLRMYTINILSLWWLWHAIDDNFRIMIIRHNTQFFSLFLLGLSFLLSIYWPQTSVDYFCYIYMFPLMAVSWEIQISIWNKLWWKMWSVYDIQIRCYKICQRSDVNDVIFQVYSHVLVSRSVPVDMHQRNL